MKTALSEGAGLSHRYLQFVFAASLVLLVSGCKKDKENSAVVEEVPAAAPPKETDTSATLAEEPNLQQVGKDKPGSAKNTFHPGKGKNAAAAPASEAGFSDAGHYVVQVAIFKSKKQAGALVEKLSGQGYPAYVAEVSDPVPQLSGTYHRVRIGKFLKIGDAKAFGDNTLKPLGYDYWVDNKKNDGVGGAGGSYSAPASEPASEPSAEAPAPRKGKKAKTAAAAEPSAPPGGTWGTPSEAAPSEPKTAEPAAPSSGDSWSNSKPESSTPASSDLPGTKPAPAAASSSAPATEPAPASSAKAPGQPAKADSGKVNLDEW